MSFVFATQIRRRKPSLTPMIDVVFLLLVFFMLAARFTLDGAISVSGPSGQLEAYAGPPRLIDISPDVTRLNGRMVENLAVELNALTESSDDTILLRPVDGAPLQRLVDVMELLESAGFTGLVLVE